MRNPPQHVITNLGLLVTHVLDPLRAKLARPIVITSGWRPTELNVLVGGSNRSQHVGGQAADFIVPGLPVIDVCESIVAMQLPFDQLIYEFGAWTHVSFSTTRRRREVITARKHGRKTVYVPGLPGEKQ